MCPLGGEGWWELVRGGGEVMDCALLNIASPDFEQSMSEGG